MSLATRENPTIEGRVAVPPVTWVMLLGTFLMGTSEFLIAGLLPQMAADLGVSVAQAGLAITLFAVGMVVGPPITALLTLKLPRRTTLVIALLVFAAGHLVAAATPDFAVLLIARFVTAVATGSFWAVASVVTADAAGPAASSRALGIVVGGAMLANVAGVPLGSFAGQTFGWRGPLWILAVLAVGAAIAVAVLVPHDRDRPTPSIRGEFAALRSGRLWLVLLTCALVNFGVLSLYSFISPLVTRSMHLPDGVVPIALVLFGAAALAGSVIAGRLGDRRPWTVVAVTAGATLVIEIGLAFTLGSAVPALTLFTLLGLTGLSANPVLVALVMRFAGNAPTLAGALTPSSFNLGTAIGTGLTAAMIDTHIGLAAPSVVAITGAVLVVVPIVILLVMHRRRGDA
jgi:predicted MFS family arabinose efflux permease